MMMMMMMMMKKKKKKKRKKKNKNKKKNNNNNKKKRKKKKKKKKKKKNNNNKAIKCTEVDGPLILRLLDPASIAFIFLLLHYIYMESIVSFAFLRTHYARGMPRFRLVTVSLDLLGLFVRQPWPPNPGR